jgi:hypothetical protein
MQSDPNAAGWSSHVDIKTRRWLYILSKVYRSKRDQQQKRKLGGEWKRVPYVILLTSISKSTSWQH